MDDALVASGRYVRIVTRGRRSGVPRAVTLGFIEDDVGPPGTILVAATATDASWALNLLAGPACQATIAERTFDAIAERMSGPDHARAIRSLILRYGTSAEGLGHGPSFRLVPATEGPG